MPRYDDLGGYQQDAPAPAPDDGIATGAIHTKQQEDAIKDKASSGTIITNDDLGYLGHFGNDDVLRKGHNAGHKPLGAPPAFRGMATKGFKKLAGSASPFMGAATSFDQMCARDGMPATARHNPPTMPKVDGARPKLPRVKLSAPVAVPMPKPKPMEVVVVGRKKG